MSVCRFELFPILPFPGVTKALILTLGYPPQFSHCHCLSVRIVFRFMLFIESLQIEECHRRLVFSPVLLPPSIISQFSSLAVLLTDWFFFFSFSLCVLIYIQVFRLFYPGPLFTNVSIIPHKSRSKSITPRATASKSKSQWKGKRQIDRHILWFFIYSRPTNRICSTFSKACAGLWLGLSSQWNSFFLALSNYLISTADIKKETIRERKNNTVQEEKLQPPRPLCRAAPPSQSFHSRASNLSLTHTRVAVKKR